MAVSCIIFFGMSSTTLRHAEDSLRFDLGVPNVYNNYYYNVPAPKGGN